MRVRCAMLCSSLTHFKRKLSQCFLVRGRWLESFTSIRLAHAKNKQPLVKDVTLYYYDRRKFFRLVGLACASQFVFWAWMAYCQISRIKLSDLRDLGNKKGRGEILDVSSRSGISWKIFRFVEERPLTLATTAVVVGLFFTTTGWIYSIRNVNRLVLQGNNLKVLTHTPLGGTRSVAVALSNVSCLGSRMDTKPQVTLKLKGHRFFFLVDKDGNFLQPTLFDKTVGIRRF